VRIFVRVVCTDSSVEDLDHISNINVRETGELWLFEAPGSKPRRLFLPGEWEWFEASILQREGV